MCPLGAAAQAAPMISGNPTAMYNADLKNGSATGSVMLSSTDMGVKMDIKLNLPKEGAPFMYHIHAKALAPVCSPEYLHEDAMLMQTII